MEYGSFINLVFNQSATNFLLYDYKTLSNPKGLFDFILQLFCLEDYIKRLRFIKKFLNYPKTRRLVITTAIGEIFVQNSKSHRVALGNSLVQKVTYRSCIACV